MRSTAVAVLAMLVGTSAAFAQIKGPATIEVQVGRLAPFTLQVDGEKAKYTILGGDVFGAFREYSAPNEFKFQAMGYSPGTGYVVVSAVKAGEPLDLFVVTIKVVGVTPPQPPKPPDPPPVPPTPPTPPTPPSPIPGDGLRVLMIYESGDLAALPKEQLGVLFARKVREYLDTKCPVGPDGATHEWRMWDKDVDASGDAKVWQDALKRPRKQVPWIIVSNGKSGFEGPLPANADECLKLLKKYGGE